MKNSCFKKALSLLLAALILLAALPVVSLAADDAPPPTAATPTDATPSDASAEVYEAADYNDAVRYVRDRLLARETVIRVACPDPSFEATCWESIFAYDSKSPFTGDYLKNSLIRTGPEQISSLSDGSYQFNVNYWEGCRPEEEAAVSAAVAAILAELSLDGNSPYEKALAIYTWLCEHVRPLAPSESQDVHHSAYAALVPGADGRRAAVCQGFSAAFYALALSAGLEARIILGSHTGGKNQVIKHMWNIVQLGSYWYYLDAFAGACYGKDDVAPGREDGMNAYFQAAANQMKSLQWVDGVWGALSNNRNLSAEYFFNCYDFAGANALYPRLSTTNVPNNAQASTIWYRNVQWLKLRDCEVYYRLPASLLGHVKVSDAKLFIQGQNLLSFDNIPAMDAENLNTGYPVMKAVNMGLSVIF